MQRVRDPDRNPAERHARRDPRGVSTGRGRGAWSHRLRRRPRGVSGIRLSGYDVRYPAIGDYGMIGDLRSAALVSKQGSIDWVCLPRFDSPWLFGRLLDWDKGGFLQLIPLQAGASIFRQYRRDSNVLQTIWTLEHSRMRVVDFMPVALRDKKLRPPESLRLVRMMQPLAGRIEWKLTFKPRFDYGRAVPSLRKLRPGMVVADGEDASIFLQYPVGATLELVDGTA